MGRDVISRLGPGGMARWWVLIFALSVPCFATTRTAASCSESDVQTTMSLMATGDTTIIPTTGGPTCTWTTNPTVPVSGTIQCAPGVTINLSSSNGVYFDYHITDSGHQRVTGCTWSGTPAFSAIGFQGRPADARADHNTFNTAGRSILFGTQNDLAPPCYPIPGSIDNNTFSGTGSFAQISGCNEAWRSANNEGSTNLVFIETNTITYTGGGYNNSSVGFDGGTGAQVVIRYNTTVNTWFSTHDTGSTPSSRSIRNFEIYNNTMTCSKGATSNGCGNALNLRGGTGVIFNNSIAMDIAGSGTNGFNPAAPTEIYRVTTAGGAPFDFITNAQTHGVCNLTYESFRLYCSTDQSVCYSVGTGCGTGGTCAESCTTNAQCGGGTVTNACTQAANFDGSGASGYPSRDQTGVGPDAANAAATQTAAADPVYIWGNTDPNNANALITPFVTIGGVDAPYIQINREYYEQGSSFTGATGVGSGPVASRPSTCTTGVAWWDTVNNWLDKCTATNTWTNAAYVPAAYPNALAATTGPTLNGAFKATGTWN